MGLQGGSNPRGALKTGLNLDKLMKMKGIRNRKVHHGLRLNETLHKVIQKDSVTKKAHANENARGFFAAIILHYHAVTTLLLMMFLLLLEKGMEIKRTRWLGDNSQTQF